MGASLHPNKEQRDASVALLREWGIDGHAVPADSWDRGGYQVRVEGEPGQREYLGWPEGFPVEKLIEVRGGIQ